MMIRRTGIYFSFWDETASGWIEKNIVDASIPITWYLSYPIQFEETLSVREMIQLLEPHADVLELVMIRELAGIDIAEILDLSKKIKAVPAKIAPNTTFVIKIADAIPTMTDDFEEISFLNWYPVLVGIEQVDETGENDEAHSLSAIDFLDWCDLPLEVDDFIEFLNPETEEISFEGIINWTLGELIGVVISQVSTTLQVNQTAIANANPDSGPLQMESIFDWLEDLDRIFLK